MLESFGIREQFLIEALNTHTTNKTHGKILVYEPKAIWMIVFTWSKQWEIPSLLKLDELNGKNKKKLIFFIPGEIRVTPA